MTACSSEARPDSSDSTNQFQHGLNFVKICMAEQVGVEVTLSGWYHPSGPREEPFRATIQELDANTPNKCVAKVLTFDGEIAYLISDQLVFSDTKVTWKQLSESARKEHIKDYKGKSASTDRMDHFAEALRDHYHVNSSHIILSLDGDGSNRETVLSYFPQEDTRPRFLTFEIEPDVALAQQLLYGQKDVIYTGAQRGAVYDSLGSTPGIEDLIIYRKSQSGRENTLFTKQDCENVVALNLDYCGGPKAGLNFEKAQQDLSKIYARLPHLMVLSITMSKRQRPNIMNDFEKYAQTPYGFRKIKTFNSGKVVCCLYVRDRQVTRLFRLPTTTAEELMLVVQGREAESMSTYCIEDEKERTIEDWSILEAVPDPNLSLPFVYLCRENYKQKVEMPKSMEDLLKLASETLFNNVSQEVVFEKIEKNNGYSTISDIDSIYVGQKLYFEINASTFETCEACETDDDGFSDASSVGFRYANHQICCNAWCLIKKTDGAEKAYCGNKETNPRTVDHNWVDIKEYQKTCEPDDKIKEQFKFVCKSCPDAWAFPNASKPFMRVTQIPKAGNSKTCRNKLCSKYDALQLENALKKLAPPTPLTPHTTHGKKRGADGHVKNVKKSSFSQPTRKRFDMLSTEKLKEVGKQIKQQLNNLKQKRNKAKQKINKDIGQQKLKKLQQKLESTKQTIKHFKQILKTFKQTLNFIDEIRSI